MSIEQCCRDAVEAMLDPVRSECAVCGDGCSGILHYGVPSCSACNAFFRRSVCQNRVYHCQNNNNGCSVDKSDRCVCRACRMAKCVRVGMKTHYVQTPRIGYKKRKEVIKSKKEDDGGHWNQSNEDTLPSSPVTHTPSTVSNPASSSFIQTLIGQSRVIREKRRYIFADSLQILFNEAQTAVGQRIMLRQFVGVHWLLERCYTTVRLGGYKEGRWILPDLTSVQMHHLPQSHIHPHTSTFPSSPQSAAKMPIRERAMSEVCKPMQFIGFDDGDFVGLSVLLFWNAAKQAHISEETKECGLREQRMVMNHLFEWYRVHHDDAVDRFGNVLLMTQNIYSILMQMRESFHFMRFFDIVKFDPILSDVVFT